MLYVMENPTWGYGLDFIRALRRRFGARAICVYTQEDALPRSRRLQPELFNPAYIEASYRAARRPCPSSSPTCARATPSKA